MLKETKKFNMEEIYSEMALENTKTTKIEEYMKYVKVVRKNWNRIWDFCVRKVIFSLKFDSYIYKDKAISRIATEIIEKIKNKENVYERYRRYFNEKKFEEDKNKPIMLAI